MQDYQNFCIYYRIQPNSLKTASVYKAFKFFGLWPKKTDIYQSKINKNKI